MKTFKIGNKDYIRCNVSGAVCNQQPSLDYAYITAKREKYVVGDIVMYFSDSGNAYVKGTIAARTNDDYYIVESVYDEKHITIFDIKGVLIANSDRKDTSVPNVSTSFMAAYNRAGASIAACMVELDDNGDIKIGNDGDITIKPIKEKYTKAEVIELLDELHELHEKPIKHDFFRIHGKSTYDFIREFKEENIM